MDIERFSELVGEIYDASLDPSLWPTTFQKILHHIGATACALITQDIVRRDTVLHFHHGYEEHFVQLYMDKFGRTNPLFPTITFFDVEKPISLPDCLPRDELCRSQMAKEWLHPQGLVDGLFFNVEKSATNCAVFSVNVQHDGWARRRRDVAPSRTAHAAYQTFGADW